MQPLVALVQCGFAHLSYKTDTPATRGAIMLAKRGISLALLLSRSLHSTQAL